MKKNNESKKINLCFDGRVLKNGLVENNGRTGIYFVARNLFLELFDRQNEINVSLFLEKNDTDILDKLNANLGVKITNDKIYTEDSDFSKIDAFFSPIFKIPDAVRKYPNVSCYTVLYDIIALLYPQYFSKNIYSDWYNEFINSLNNNDYYFSISDYTKRDFLKFFSQLGEEKISTIPLSTNFTYKPNHNKNNLHDIRQKYNIPENKKYLFSLCSLEPRKNLIRSVKCFIEFIKKNKIDDLVYVLGGASWGNFIEKLEKEVPDFEKYKNKIVRAGYVADDDMEALYSNAEWFVYTSQYEGFGMPPLEAMACGTAVIASNSSSLPEVVGNAGIMIDWDSDEQHIAAYEKYYFDKKLRDEMAQKGLERSKQFSWDKATDIILEKIKEVEDKKEQTPLVTVITPTFNLIKEGRKDSFAKTVESVRKQTYKNIEHIVVDGASKDDSIRLLEEYQKKGLIKYYSEPDKGLYDAINKGILKSNGKYVIVLNSDDSYCNNKAIEMLVKKAEELDADACCAGAKTVDPRTLEVKNLWSCYYTRLLIFGTHACHQTFLIKTNVMKELGLYDLQYKVSADTAFMYKLLNHNKKICMIEPIIIAYSLGGISNDGEKVKNDVINSMFENYGQYHNLTQLDCSYLWNKQYTKLPLNEAIALGSKLNKSEWRQEYFKYLFQNYNVEGDNLSFSGVQGIKTILKIFGFIPFIKIRKDLNSMKIKLFGFLPLYGHKQIGGRNVWKIFGLPIFKIRKMANGVTTKYYILGIPVLKVSKKVCTK